MTDIDPVTADRLARLGNRQSAAGRSTTAGAARRRPSDHPTSTPAAASKIVATGASAMAVLGMMAAFGQTAAGTSPDGASMSVPSAAPAAESSTAGLVPSSLDPAGSGLVLVDEASDRVATLSPVEAPNRIQLALPTPDTVVISPPAASQAAAPPAAPPAPVATSQGS